ARTAGPRSPAPRMRCPAEGRTRTGTASDGLLLQLLERPDRGQEDAQADVHEIDVGDRQRDVPGDHDALVEDAVDELDQRHLLLERQVAAHARSVKLYGGHGPVSTSSIRSAAYERPSSVS